MRAVHNRSSGAERVQVSFNPVDYHFSWEGDWYRWDGEAARKAAMADRSAEAKRLRKDGWTVRLWSQKSLISRGGIGSGHPHIELWTTAYYIDAVRPEVA